MKYKLCPICRYKCKPSDPECPDCGTDITVVPITDEANKETSKEEATQPVIEESGEFIRICDSCDTENKSNARKCKNCNEDIGHIAPVLSRADADVYELTSIDGKFRFDIVKPLYVLGRTNEFSEYLSAKPFVSGTHAKIIKESDNRVCLIDVGSTNGTYINNKRIEKDSPVFLAENDEIGLGGNKNNGHYQEKAAYFIFKAKC